MKSLTPLRYPGGKAKIYNEIKQIISHNNLSDKIYIEPFAGSFGIGIQLLLNDDVKKVIINDYDYHIYAFWRSIFNETSKLVEKIKETSVTVDEWYKQKEIFKNYKCHTLFEVGFSTLFLNRTNYSGILKGGPIGGREQKGFYKIDCRFNKDRLIQLINKIASYKKCVKVYNYDAKTLITKLKPKEEEIFYNLDPPYVVNGKDLYVNFYKEKDHIKLKEYVDEITCPWIMTYDNTDFIKNLYKDYFVEEIKLRYSAKNHKLGDEVLISNFLIGI